jgi:hypothetical protein
LNKSLTRRLVLAIVLGMLCGTLAHADTPTPTPQSVTGTDPVPTSPHVVAVILTLLQTLL